MNSPRQFGYYAWKDLVQAFPETANLSALALETALERCFMEYRAAHPNYGRQAVDKANGIPPPLDQVKAYFKELGSSCNAEDFVDHYSTVGWVVGRSKTPMKDWRSACRLWSRRSATMGTQPVQKFSASVFSIQTQLKKVEDEMTEILYPGGAAFKTIPEGKKMDHYLSLQRQRNGLKEMLKDFSNAGNHENA